ncbi:hypothetical protein KO494_07610 [Lacinutrix sp. C3R15]|uniref:hypothetical protein n=1 Tax=Flavobacteriaceae TaxID=49546 RepID=UPI001C0934DC|nr:MULTISPECIES: hypothetical protein [Flavobacteriaceae]MBU2939404.1 hypothetical protein [Lacinutrix sp. C3R15]MDO6622719.1 hypothetical protein [Oceanihabitans sp. 1_MG-2023]
MKYLFLLPVLLLITNSFSQDAEIVTNGSSSYGNSEINGASTNGLWIKNASVVNDMEGSSYLFENWNNNAIIYDLSGKSYNLPNCNFNIESNRIEAQLDDVKDKIFAFNTRDITKVEINNKVFLKKNTTKGNNRLVEVLQEGDKTTLFKAYDISITKATVNPMTQQKMGKDKIVIQTKYYVEKANKTQPIKLKKAVLMEVMVDKKNEVKTYIKENKLSITKEQDLIEILNYYNTLS